MKFGVQVYGYYLCLVWIVLEHGELKTIFVCFLFFLFELFETGSHYLVLASLELTDAPISASQSARVKAYTRQDYVFNTTDFRIRLHYAF